MFDTTTHGGVVKKMGVQRDHLLISNDPLDGDVKFNSSTMFKPVPTDQFHLTKAMRCINPIYLLWPLQRAAIFRLPDANNNSKNKTKQRLNHSLKSDESSPPSLFETTQNPTSIRLYLFLQELRAARTQTQSRQ